MRVLSAILTLTLAALVSHAGDKKKNDPGQIGNRDVGKCVNFYSIEKEMALGKQLSEEVMRQAKVNDDPLIAEFVNRIGQNLVRNSDARVPFTFRVIEGEAPNAFALPGGYVFIYTGLLKMADEEDEFAGAVAHEIAHVAARHMTCQATKGDIANIAMIPVSILLGGWGGVAARQAANIGIPTAFLSFSRKDESEADFLGVQYMYAAGYDPTGAVSIFEKLEALERRKPGTIQKIFSTHPMDATRIEKTQEEIQSILPSKPEYVVTTSEYTSIRERLMRLEDRRKLEKDDGRPHLRVAPGTGKPEEKGDSDDRPTIRRRDLVD